MAFTPREELILKARAALDSADLALQAKISERDTLRSTMESQKNTDINLALASFDTAITQLIADKAIAEDTLKAIK